MILRDGEDGGDGIDGEDEIHDVDHNQDQREGREHPVAVHFDGKFLLVVLGCDAHPASAKAENEVALEIDLFAVTDEHADTGDEEKRAEEVENPVEALHQRDPEPDHGAAHEERADDSPHQHAMLILPAHLEVGKNENEDEDVVDAERIFDDVAGEEIERCLRPFQVPDEEIKAERKEDPDEAPDGGFANADDVGLAIKPDEVDRENEKDAEVKGDPEPKWHARLVSMPGGLSQTQTGARRGVFCGEGDCSP